MVREGDELAVGVRGVGDHRDTTIDLNETGIAKFHTPSRAELVLRRYRSQDAVTAFSR